MSKCLRVVAIVTLLIGCVAPPLLAWDTRVEEGYPVDSWLSIYQAGEAISIPEHSALSDLALKQLGVYELFGRKGSARMDVVDLNASLFRHGLLSGKPRKGDDPATELEERRIPQPALFAGIPDYSYTIYDWLNKNELCPAMSQDDGNCHVFALGWLGDLNAVHFGSQARNMYAHYHFIAKAMAWQARDLRKKLQDVSEADYQHHKDAVKELELLALGYEGYAQHFLQDRWAMGHMWERWSATDYRQLPDKRPLANNAISAVAGLLHGSEAVVGVSRPIKFALDLDVPNIGVIPIPFDLGTAEPAGILNTADPMSSPVIRDGRAAPMEWRHGGKSGPMSGPFPGVGDERLNDSQILVGSNSGYFGAGYQGIEKDYPFAVIHQRDQMLKCSKSGWAEVIRALGQTDGGYGSWAAPLAGSAPSFNVVEEDDCWNMWATNESMYIGLVGDQLAGKAITVAALARLFVDVASLNSARAAGVRLPTDDLVDIAWRLWRAKNDKPHGTQMATGGIGPLMGFQTGDKYNAPEYWEPSDFMEQDADSLADEDKRGKDKQSLFGAFNRGFSRHWCRKLPELLKPLRDSDEPREQEACLYLAGMAHHSTLKDYNGERREMLEDRQGNEVSSLCHINEMFVESDTDDNPLYLQPGYVAEPQKRNSKNDYDSLENWCEKIPVLKLEEAPELRDADVVAVIKVNEEEAGFEGLHLGREEGQLSITGPNGDLDFEVEDWGDRRIDILLNTDEEIEPDDYEVILTRADGESGVGRFILRIESPEIVTEALSVQITVPEACAMPGGFENLPTVDFLASIEGWEALDVRSMKRLHEPAEGFWTESAELMAEAADCIDKRRKAAVPSHYSSKTRKAHDFPDKGRYLAVIIENIDGSINRVGERAYMFERNRRMRVWAQLDGLLYDYHSRVLRQMVDDFRQQPGTLKNETEKLEALKKQNRKASSKALEKQILAHRQTTYERLFRDYRAAPAYMAYLATGLTRWAVAERRLLEDILPYYEQNRQLRLGMLPQAYSEQGACADPRPDSWFMELPIDLAAATPAFSSMLYDLKVIHPHGLMNAWVHDLPQQHWASPQRLQETFDWRADHRVVPKVLQARGRLPCPQYDHAIKRFYDMANFEFIYGDRHDQLYGMGQTYERRFARDESDWLADKASGMTCLRCQGIERAISGMRVTLDNLGRLKDEFLPRGTAEGVVSRSAKAAGPVSERMAVLNGQLEQCRSICVEPAVKITPAKPVTRGQSQPSGELPLEVQKQLEDMKKRVEALKNFEPQMIEVEPPPVIEFEPIDPGPPPREYPQSTDQ